MRERSGMPLDPYFSAGKLAWLLEHDEAVAAARDAGTLRLGTVDSCLCDRLGAGFATDPSTASRTQLAPARPSWDAAAARDLRRARATRCRRSRDTAGDLGVLRHESWPQELPLRARCVDQQAALAGAGCVRAGPGQGDLRHRRLRPRPRRRRAARAGGGLLPTVAWRVDGEVEWAIDGGVFTAGALLEWLSRDLGLAADPPALAARAAEVEDAGGVRVLPALAGVGAPWWRSDARAVLAGHDRRLATAGTSPAPRWRRSPGASPTSSPWSARRRRSTCCASTAG